jgi:hypothetical protein
LMDEADIVSPRYIKDYIAPAFRWQPFPFVEIDRPSRLC